MRRQQRWSLAALFVVGLVTAACGSYPAEAADEPAVTVEAIGGTDLKQIVLSEKAAARLGVETATVAEELIDGASRLVIPYAAVVYDAQGAAWAYANPESRQFRRQAIVVDRIVGDRALLLDGPPVGTTVVTVGVAELWGVETGVGGGH